MIIFTGDFHIEKGIWISITIDYLDYLKHYCQERSIRTIIVNGDIFEKATKIHNEAFVPLFMKFMEMKREGFDLIFLLGNHDIFNDSNDSIVETFSPFGRVIKDSCSLEIENDYYDLLSYTKDRTKIPNTNRTLLTHLPITSFQFDNGFTNVDDGFSPDDFSNYNLVVSGHFHRHQENGKIVYAGSPYEKNFGEEGQEKGFLVINEGHSKFVPYTNAPKHLTINIEDFDKYDYRNKFVQVKISKKTENFVKLRHLLYERGAIEVKPMFDKEQEEVSLQDIKLDGSGNIVSIVKQYLGEVKMENIDNKKLLIKFDKVLEEVK
jgi:DNA repair exonuclease SbcCD nuclease subunit